jgi:acyl-CoA thioester hydrolase
MSALVHRSLHRVSYAHCTVGNHVYHSRYLDILEAARGEFFRELGHSFASWQERDTIFPVIDCQLTFKAPARYDDVLTVELWLTEAQRIRLNFDCRILNAEGTLLVVGSTQHVSTTLHDKPRRIPPELAASLSPYLFAAAREF